MEREMNSPSEKWIASVLAVGTELTTGQIINRNAAWISGELDSLGIEVVLHETVADDRVRILEALERCAKTSHLLFVTGGLGPTSDDFTREIISEWLGLPLEFDENSWQAIQKRLGDFKISIAPSNRQQCFFPKGAEILGNPEGTAAGFRIKRDAPNISKAHLGMMESVWILPGPPNEIRAIWNKGIHPELLRTLPKQTITQLFTWQCLGKSEAELGEITEETLKGSNLKIGYRAHRPYIEIKVWVPEDQLATKTQWLERLTQVLAPYTYSRNGEDLVLNFLHHIARADSVEIFDSASGGYLSQRLADSLRHEKDFARIESLCLNQEWGTGGDPIFRVQSTLEQAAQADENTLTFVLSGFTPDGIGSVGFREAHRVFQRQIQTPYKTVALTDRMRGYLVEAALKQWCEWLDTTVS
ncbi:MAG: competence/damage-inducible protein A [Bdellovibrio sp.]|nr:competence/damage-inducible protein A [Bdellovibrio sp.]